MWSQLSAEQKLNYGEDYFERALRSLEKYTEKVIVTVWFNTCQLALGVLYFFVGTPKFKLCLYFVFLFWVVIGC